MKSILTDRGGCGARRFFLAECRIEAFPGLPTSLIVSYSSSNGLLLILSCDDPLEIGC